MGEEFRVTLPKGDYGEGNPAQPVLAFTRVESPELEAAEIRENGAWVPIVAGSLHPDGPTELRFGFSHPMNKASVEESLQGAEGLFTWESDSSVTVLIPDPPPGIEWWGTHMRDSNGIWCPFSTHLYFGEPPHLYSYDPATGQEVEVCEAPPDILAADVSPDGAELEVLVYDGTEPFRGHGLIVDAATGRCVPDETPLPGHWSALVPDDVGEIYFTALSPDRSKVAAYKVRAHEWIGDLSILDAATGDALREYPQFAKVPAYATDLYMYVETDLLCWSPDGKTLVVVARSGQLATEDYVIREVDVVTGQVTDITLDLASEGIRGWSPDGKLWLMGHKFVDIQTLQAVASFPEPPDPNQDWSWVAFGGGWEASRFDPPPSGLLPTRACILRNLATGQELSLGPVCPAGWDESGRLYFIRWAGAAWRHQQAPSEPKDESGM